MRRRLLSEIDARAESLGINRSQYFAALARNDIASGGNIVLHNSDSPANPTAQRTNGAETSGPIKLPAKLGRAAKSEVLALKERLQNRDK